MSNIAPPNSFSELPSSVIKNVISLSTSGFGVVVALAWNEAIKATVTQFIDPYFGKSSGVISLFIYALVITLLAVFATMQLSYIQKKLETVKTKTKKKK